MNTLRSASQSAAAARRLASSLVLCAGIMLGGAASAPAAVPTSQITSPTDPTHSFFDGTLASPGTAFTVTGTANFASGELRCYNGTIGNSYGILVAAPIAIPGGSFSVPVTNDKLVTNDAGNPCVLRMVPAGEANPHPPGGSDPLAGPVIATTKLTPYFLSGTTGFKDYDFTPTSTSAYFDFDTSGSCGLTFSRLYAPSTLKPSDYVFYCNAALFYENFDQTSTATRSEIRIDGANAYDPAAAAYSSAVKAGIPEIAVTKSFDPATGLVSFTTREPIVRCPGTVAFPPTAGTCPSFVSAGVELDRTWLTTNDNHLALMLDSWVATDGQAHALDALYDQDLARAAAPLHGAFQFPGSASWVDPAYGDTFSLPAGPGKILYKESSTTPDGGDGVHPHAAIAYSSPPDAPLKFLFSDISPTNTPEWVMPYTRTIPAAGAFTLRMAFAQGYGLAEVQALAGAALASYAPPAVPIASPAGGAGTPAVPAPAGAGNVLAALGGPVVHGTSVTEQLSCQGPAGSSCAVSAVLTSTERLSGKRLVGLSARTKRARTKRKTVLVGSATITIPAGRTAPVSVPLNALGKRLLARFHRLPATLTVSANGRRVLSQPVTFKAKKKKSKKPTKH